MNDPARLPYGGGGDAQAGAAPLPARFRRHADMLARSGRSPLYIELMRAAAGDIERGGEVARLFEGVAAPPGSVPQLRLAAALHYLVLSGEAPALAAFYPSAGGDRPPAEVWPVVLGTIAEHFEEVKGRLHRTVQTNEPGRSAVLFSGLLWLAARHRRPIRLLEVGASAGLNLLADRYCYVVGGAELGDPAAPLRFVDPWAPPPPVDLAAAAAQLRIVARAGCDLAPLDPTRPGDQLTLLSYIWPDEPHRIERMRAALSVAARDPVPVARRRGSEWLPEALEAAGDGELVVVWHSVMRQYVDRDEWAAIEGALDGRPGVVRLSMEPALDPTARMQLTVHDPARAPARRLAVCDDHGLPIRWETYSPAA
ncbi:MAG TPA: DUF2332 domain-containing protein [Solirubrobacteraceae bacterium]|nr:DUF2332 domain-containing protein [Solirubrobacteraceae bacterium]